MRILLVEDNQIVREAVGAALHAQKFLVDISATGQDGWFRGATEDYDCAILDLGLPDLDGLTILRRWRSDNIDMPVLVLTSRARWFERVEGLNLGADDYLAKPFRLAELIARLNAVVRRSKGLASSRIACQGILIDLHNGKISANNCDIELAPLEWRVIALLAREKGATVPAHRLMDHVYGVNSDKSANALEALIKRLRRKLPVDLIRTRRGVGYMIADQDASTDAASHAHPGGAFPREH